MRDSRRDSAKHSKAIGDWMLRSGDLPLAISTVGETMYREHYHQILVQISHRIRSLDISDMQIAQILFVAGLDAPLVEEVRFRVSRYWEDDVGQRAEVVTSTLFRGKNLRRVTLCASEVRSFVPTAPFMWDHLTNLSLVAGAANNGGLYYHIARRLLKGCPNLRSFKFAFETEGSQDELFPTELLTLPNLEALTIFIPHTDIFHVYKDFIDLLFMPRLTSFHLVNESSKTSRTSPGEPLSDLVFLDRLADRSREIVNLTLDLLYFTGTTGVHLLQLFPGLQTLHLIARETPSPSVFGWQWTMGRSKHDAIELIKLLTPKGPEWLCPALTEFVLESGSNVTEFTDVIINFLQMHLDSGTSFKLRRFNICCVRDPQPGGTGPDFQPFRNGGIIINTAYTDPPKLAFGHSIFGSVPTSAFGGMPF
ncbi:hypothetical protein FB45DRAFT_1018141 [Roridomyces roridus]|uniref:F-box domain-containing protein n=1 Tax=Roridomyces roridus TaxID=1738132 RepID=A0AAD7FZ40_9AGAR|nr:hypothetical protein FB45DRAFT_1018141 [Roridomyces roridus]